MTDKRLIGAENEHAILKNLHRFGWLTTKMVAALQWPNAGQSEAMARRTLRRLLDEKLIIKRLSEGNTLWLLSATGARLLNEQYGINAGSGQSLKLGNTLHRACSNWLLIQKHNDGFSFFTEHEIQTKKAPWGELDGKTADGLIDTEQGLVWVEVENSWKNRTRRHSIVELCHRHLSHESNTMTALNGGHHLARLAIVGTNVDAIRMMIQSFLEGFSSGMLRDAHMANIDIIYLPVTSGLLKQDGWSKQLWADIIAPP